MTDNKQQAGLDVAKETRLLGESATSGAGDQWRVFVQESAVADLIRRAKREALLDAADRLASDDPKIIGKGRTFRTMGEDFAADEIRHLAAEYEEPKL